MKARVVHDLDGAEPLGANVARIVAVRVAELRSFVPAAFDPADVTALHDLRIAAIGRQRSTNRVESAPSVARSSASSRRSQVTWPLSDTAIRSPPTHA